MDGLLLCNSLKDSMPPINREHLGLPDLLEWAWDTHKGISGHTISQH